MLGNILASVGGSIGKYFGGGILSTIGRYAGKYLGNYLDKKWHHHSKTTHKFTNIKDSFYISKAEYGQPIPLIFGRMRVPGQIIWADQITEKRNTTTVSRYFKQKNTTIHDQTTELEYFANFALALCEGEILDIGRVWCGEDFVDLSKYKFRLYKGDETQLPDLLISSKSKDPTPAYRGLAYIVFEQLPLADFNDIIPSFSFEITRKPNIKKTASVEDIVESMIMIPGSGEYVYDTIIQEKKVLDPFGGIISTNIINSHNHYNIANSVYGLNQLQMICENVKWVSPVVCWFGNNVNAKECLIKPGVEFKEENLSYSETWKVSKYNRKIAHNITKDDHGNPIYGGSVNDASVIRYLEEIKRRNLKIMFYPMFFLDVPNKPWRGHVTTDSEHVAQFFQRQHGYNDFILHYAHLVKDHVDAFVIGSELIGLTKINDNNHFPAVDELVKLANQVKKIVGTKVLVTYAADWSEYHHADGGWFNLDPLWGSPDIDFVGIDAYFPVTDTLSSTITPEEIADGWAKGEGYDYYIDKSNNSKKPLTQQYAWKNLKYWWENIHVNPNQLATPWRPRLKPIWFTEFGFPSIDKAPNQPNVFFDPKCIDGGIPKYSSGETDFSIQRKAIRAFIEYWKTQEYIGQMFLWTWDARPYPAWPHMDIWKDGYLWEKGHWVNNKFGAASLASIILEISDKCQLDIDKIDVSSIDQPVEGFLLSNKITGVNAINILRTAYFFDITSYNSKLITFLKRAQNKEILINSSLCIKLTNNSYFEEIYIPRSLTLNKIDLYFINQEKEYDTFYKYLNNEEISYTNKANINLPIVMTEHEAEQIGTIIIKNASTEKKIIKFILPSTSIKLQPGDFITLMHQNIRYFLRVISLILDGLKLTVIGVIDSRNNYFLKIHTKTKLNLQFQEPQKDKLIILNLPLFPQDTNTPFIAAYYHGAMTAPLYAKFSEDTEDNWSRIATLSPYYSIASVQNFEQKLPANIFHIDEANHILIKADKFTLPESNNWHYAMIGKELISFNNIEKLDENLYRISKLIRGMKGTDAYINTHAHGEIFVLIDYGIHILPISDKIENQTIDFKCASAKSSIIYQNLAKKPIEPFIVKQKIKNSILCLKWTPRAKDDGNWKFTEPFVSHKYNIIITAKDEQIASETSECKINIDLKSLDLSDGYNVNIITTNN